ncbi:inositol monophosphatase [Actinomycetospora sp. NBRC 106375]|uniref:inositol monophosphatase family protein n=1 Tax=Actinomycetospora sp. NBRC 106375 TaxID=3032207 RepID=UPI00249FCC26|nr:inositol monophosphatase [Actinomycetospora sp. NBRC 106375]GLZ45854.1 inositol monophosphatase [Actinomycetospora sp. NBRC 106375]
MTDLEALAGTAERAARAGGAVLLEYRDKVLEVTLKDARVDVSSSADLAAQEATIAAIRAERPDDVVLGEEDAPDVSRPGEGLQWWVDPLDGTRSFIDGFPWFATAVSVTLGGEPVVAAVYDPLRDELFRAVRGGGATCNGTSLRVSGAEKAAEVVVVVQAQSSDPAVIAEFARLMRAMLTVSGGVRFPGAPALVMAHLAAGHLGGYVERDMPPWDVAGGRLLVEEAGGRVTDFAGRVRDASTRYDVVASSGGAVHDELVAATGLRFEEGR